MSLPLTRRIEIPFVYCFGAQKAGTTWLFRTLQRTAGLRTPLKEPHYFDRYSGHWDVQRHANVRFATRLRELLERPGAVESHRKRLDVLLDRLHLIDDEDYVDFILRHAGEAPLSGDFTPENGVAGPAGMARMRECAPDAVAVLLMRDPVARVWSAARMAAAYGYPETTGSLDGLLTFLRQTAAYALSDYPNILRDIRTHFPDPIVDIYESAFEDRRSAKALVTRIATRAGVPVRLPRLDFESKINVGPEETLRPDWAAALRSELDSVYRGLLAEGIGFYSGRVPGVAPVSADRSAP